jgi:RNA polymerase sigma-70 factor (ECF subfamily)
MSESDDGLIARCKNGDLSAFDLIVQRHKVPLTNFAYRFVGDQETAEDLAQETFFRVYRNIKRYKKDMAGFRTWMYRIAANLCKNELRNRSRRSRILVNSATAPGLTGGQDNGSDPIEDAPDTSAGPDHQLEEKELQEVLAQAISCLPEKLRTVLILRDIEGMPYAEISRIIDRPVGTVKSRTNRARLTLKDKVAAYVNS